MKSLILQLLFISKGNHILKVFWSCYGFYDQNETGSKRDSLLFLMRSTDFWVREGDSGWSSYYCVRKKRLTPVVSTSIVCYRLILHLTIPRQNCDFRFTTVNVVICKYLLSFSDDSLSGPMFWNLFKRSRHFTLNITIRGIYQ